MRRYLVLATLLALQPTPTIHADDHANEWKDLPATLRETLHYSASEVPAFPNEDSTLLRVHNWLPVRSIEGVLCSLEFTGGQFDVVYGPFRDFSHIKPGWSYGAHYLEAEKSQGKRARRGPSYYWRSDSTLYERAYQTPKGWRDWQYYPGYHPGRESPLYHFQISSGLNGGTPLDEYFDSNGTLVGVIDARAFYWRGHPVDHKVFFAKVTELHRGYRPHD